MCCSKSSFKFQADTHDKNGTDKERYQHASMIGDGMGLCNHQAVQNM